MSMSDGLAAIEAQVKEGLAAAQTMEALEQVRVAATGKKGQLTAIMRMMGKVPPEERPAMGKLANTVRANVDTMIRQRKEELAKAALDAKIAADSADITLPGRVSSDGSMSCTTGVSSSQSARSGALTCRS